MITLKMSWLPEDSTRTLKKFRDNSDIWNQKAQWDEVNQIDKLRMLTYTVILKFYKDFTKGEQNCDIFL